ncbi:glycosyltransferase family 4 protein [Candidatus Woesearchaeota archaeon]|nr:glycosyltransferase family 4 protein [Candidatus Woesearchaeota archaeon]
MKVVLVADDYEPPVTGIGVYTNGLAQYLSDRGHEVLVLTSDAKDKPVWDKGEYLSVYRFPGYRPRGRHFSVALPKKKRIRTLFTQFKPDLVHYQGLSPLVRAAYFEAKRLGIKHVYTNHLVMENFQSNSLMAKMFLPYLKSSHTKIQQCSDLLLTPTKHMYQRVTHQNKVHVPNFVQVKHYETERKSFHGKLLYVGRLDKEKNVESLITAMRRLQTSCTLTIVGSGSEEKRLKRKAKGLPVAFLGQLDHTMVTSLYKQHDIFVLPSTHEVFGIVLLEAMAAGMPIACSQNVQSDVVVPYVNGLLFYPHDPDDLARQVEILVRNRPLRLRCIENNQEKAQRFDVSVIGPEIEGAYASLVASSSVKQ